MSKTFEEFAAEYARAPFPWPMPDGKSIDIPQPSFDTTRKAVAAAAAEAGTLMDAIEVYAGSAAGAQIAEAWGALPSTALSAVFAEMREHFGSKN